MTYKNGILKPEILTTFKTINEQINIENSN